ncbi:Trypsin [Bradyrhizobium sp. Gha]|nr:Trypsin [Bradyrhizobium sp. Gha]
MTVGGLGRLVVILSVLTGLSSLSYAQSPDRGAILNQYKRAIVSIRVVGTDTNGKATTRRGTGVLVSDNWVVTARHVVGADSMWQELPSGPNRRIEVSSIEPNGRRTVLSEASAKLSTTDDIAVLILDSKGDTCAPISNSSISDDPKTLVGLFWGRDTNEPDSRNVDTLARGRGQGDRIVIGYKPIDGDSGSPLFDAKGYVIAILSGDADRPEASAAVPAYTARSLLPGDAVCKRDVPTGSGASSFDVLPSPWKQLESEQRDVIRARVSTSKSVPFPGNFVISGDRYWTEPSLAAERLVFEPGSRLIFKESNARTARELTVVAGEIRSLSQENPGVITWEPSSAPDTAPAGSVGQSGPAGASDGAPGGNGGKGGTGATPSPGRDGPKLTLVVKRSINPIVLDVRGQGGGPGGNGGEGGVGGAGAPGRRASSSAFDCKRGPGDGGRGGDGGMGGDGGRGGAGGNGGIVTMLTPEPEIHALSRIILRVGAGREAAGGAAGQGGRGGPGGPRGLPAPPFCANDGRDGDPGVSGRAGAGGESGLPSKDGSAFVGSISEDEVTRLVSR